MKQQYVPSISGFRIARRQAFAYFIFVTLGKTLIVEGYTHDIIAAVARHATGLRWLRAPNESCVFGEVAGVRRGKAVSYAPGWRVSSCPARVGKSTRRCR